MAKRARGTVYRKTRSYVDSKGKRRKYKQGAYRARYVDADGRPRDHVLRLPNGATTTDKGVARSLLNEILNRVERQAAGLVDTAVENARLPMRVLVGRFGRYLHRKQQTRLHIRQRIHCLTWLIEHAGIRSLADFNADRLDKGLGILAGRGKSARTLNVYRQSIKSFAKWGIRIAKILITNPADSIDRYDEGKDMRRMRRALTVAEASRLLDVSACRRLYYHLGFWTGLRVSEVRRLQWGDLELDGDRPCIRLRAEATKSRRADELPLHPSLADALRQAKPAFVEPTDCVFETLPTVATFYRDLKQAGIHRENHNGVVDRHAMRTALKTWLAEYGVLPDHQDAIMRHARHDTGGKHYLDFRVLDLWTEIAKLPGPQASEVRREAVRATGTDDVSPQGVALKSPLTVVRKGVKPSATVRIGAIACRKPDSSKPYKNRGFQAKNADSGKTIERSGNCQNGSAPSCFIGVPAVVRR